VEANQPKFKIGNSIMATGGSSPFTSDGNVNPVWMQQINNKDALTSEIAAYFFSGDVLKPEIRCFMQNCVMKSRTCSYLDEATKITEYNPMMLCFFCDRTFHCGCVDLDSYLIREESVPWQCQDCKRNLLNQHCQEYYKSSQYKILLIHRREKRIQQSFLPENRQKLKEVEFSVADIQSFDRRAVAILQDEDPESTKDITLFTPLVFRKVMQARVEKKASQEAVERYRAEMEKKEKHIKDMEERMKALELSLSKSKISDDTIDESSTQFGSPSFSGVGHSSVLTPSTPAAKVLTGHYIRNGMPPIIESDSSQEQQKTHEKIESIETPDNSQDNLNVSELSVLISRLARVDERNEDRKWLETRRKALPKISEFNGDETKWLTFKQDVERYRKNGKYDDETIKLHVRGALKGEAFNVVRDLFDIASLEQIMAVLKAAFGDEMRMVRNRSEELKNLKISSNLNKSDAVKLQTSIQAYFAACTYANTGYINTNTIAESIFVQFNAEDRQRCKEFYLMKYPTNTVIVMDVQTIYEFILRRLPLLDDVPIKKKAVEPEAKGKSKPWQMHSISEASVVRDEKSDYKFEIRDQAKAPYIGYAMDKINNLQKLCEFCGSQQHFSVQCSKYREKSEKDRLNAILDRRLCKNCVLTSAHRSSDCDFKGGCGHKTDRNSRCTSKHHISVHEADTSMQQAMRHRNPYNSYNSYKKRRPNTKHNAAVAKQKIEEAKKELKPSSSQEPIKGNCNVAFHTLDPNNVMFEYNLQQNLTLSDVKLEKAPLKSVKVFRVKVWGPKGYVVVLAIGDTGSEVTLMREDLRQVLGIKGESHTLHMQWAETTTKTCQANKVDLTIQGMEIDAPKYTMENCLAIKELTLPARSLDMGALRKQFNYLQNIPFEGYDNERPVILIGTTHAHLMEGCELVEGKGSGPIAVRTKIGWSVYGGSTQVKNIQDVRTVAEISTDSEDTELTDDESEVDLKKVTNEELHQLLLRHYSIESLGIRAVENYYTENERKAIELLKEETKVLESGSVEVPLLWNRKNNKIPLLPNNYALVLKRQLAHEKKLAKNPAHKKVYDDNMKELLSLGFMREATAADMKGIWPNVWYLPTTLVINDNKDPPKFRNVYDASCVYQGQSLNGNLLKGPDYLVDILQPLFKMRMNSIAFTADVKSMFNMIKICARDQQCQRILWRESPDQPMKTFIATVMLFGPTSSPVTSQYVKNETAKQWMDKYPEAARTLIDYTYMDDTLTSEPTVEQATKVARQCIEICKSINWQLIGFQSNSIEFLKSLPQENIKKDLIPLLEDETDNYVTKVLGCYWNTVEDCFQFNLDQNLFVQLVRDFDVKPTKRDQASTIARFHDKKGFLSHYTIRGRIMLQESWENKVPWDEKIDDRSAKAWKEWLLQLNDVTKLKFPRRLTRIDALKDADEIKLHIFCDAGKLAYGAVAYLVVKSSAGIDTSLVMAKARVTPLRLKSETKIKEIPRLELLGALLAARIGCTLRKMLHGITFESFYWTDSEVALRWIHNPNQLLPSYAIGPVVEITETTGRNDWKYVPTDLNVADLMTKMKKFDFSSNTSIWMQGPEFIKLPEKEWPEFPQKILETFSVNSIYWEQLKFATYELPTIDCPVHGNCLDKYRESIKASWTKLLRAVARRLKLFMDAFIPIIKNGLLGNKDAIEHLKKLTNGMQDLSPKDFERAEHFIFRKVHHEAFPVEYKRLRDGKPIVNKLMRQLNVFMDGEGIIRIQARGGLNSLAYPQQFAPLLPRKHRFVTALLEYHHKKYNHVATDTQVEEIRSKCWIPQLKAELRSIRAHCNKCNLDNAKPYSPKMAPLPNDRVNPALKPFEVTGIDVLGPLRPTVN
jgi:hypothetical protein